MQLQDNKELTSPLRGYYNILSLNSNYLLYSSAESIKIEVKIKVELKVAKIVLDVDRLEPSVNVYKDMKWLPLHLRRQLHLSSFMHKIINGQAPSAFVSKFAYVSGGSRDAERCNLYVPRSKTHKRSTQPRSRVLELNSFQSKNGR